MGTTLLVTGAPGVGKTTLIRAVAEELAGRTGGFVTEEIRERDRRLGFRVCALDGATAVLAHVRDIHGPRVGRYRVDVPRFDAVGVAALERAVRDADIIIADEIGKLELCSPRFVQAVESALHSPKPLLGTVLQAPHPWIDALKRRPGVELYRLSVRNRDDLKDALLARLRSAIGA
jgi:nucleoside-triphosphatase